MNILATDPRLRRHRPSCYRIRLTEQRFGQIKRTPNKRWWSAEIRDTESGNLIRQAGLWRTIREAIEELDSIIDR